MAKEKPVLETQNTLIKQTKPLLQKVIKPQKTAREQSKPQGSAKQSEDNYSHGKTKFLPINSYFKLFLT